MKPLKSTDRIVALDAIRGFALFGIMFVNMTWFTGFAVLSPEQRKGLGTERIDEIVYWLVHVLVDGKFWSIFAFLFGVGVAIQYRRSQKSGQQFTGLFVRRLSILLSIGLAHAAFLWFGDIVSLYAAAGFVLLIFVARSDRTVLIWGGILLVAPILQMAIWLVVHLLTGDPNARDPGHGPGELLYLFGEGSYVQVFSANWEFLKERWVIAVYDGRFLKLAGLFLIGWWAGKRDIFHYPMNHKRLLYGVLLFALFIGLPANLVAFTAFPGVSLRPPSVSGWVVESVKTIGIPALALGYVSLLLLCFSAFPKTRFERMLAVTGRLSLTNYVMQSALGILMFYGYGFGQWGQIGVTWSIALILVTFGLQFVFSWIWLHFFHYGPLEWAWRCLTYGRMVSLRNSSRPELPTAKGELEV